MDLVEKEQVSYIEARNYAKVRLIFSFLRVLTFYLVLLAQKKTREST